MIRDGIEVFYYAQPVDGEDQALSLVEYLSWHGWSAFKDDVDQVVIPLDCETHEEAGTKSAEIFSFIQGWRRFWEHHDKGVFGLPIYIKET